MGHRLFGAQKIMSLRYGRFGSIDSSYILERIVIFTTNCKIEPAVDLPGKAADLYSKVAKDLLGLGTAASPCSTCNKGRWYLHRLNGHLHSSCHWHWNRLLHLHGAQSECRLKTLEQMPNLRFQTTTTILADRE